MTKYFIWHNELKKVIGIVCAASAAEAIKACPEGCKLLRDWPAWKESDPK